MYEGSDYVLSIYGTKLDPNTPFAQQQKRMREPRNRNREQIEAEIQKLMEVFPDGFWIYIHKTKPELITSILNRGLEICEKGGGLDSTMSRIFDSKSEDIEGDLNYLRNSIAEGNQYGSDSIIAVFPRNEAIIYQNIIDRTGQFPKIPSKYIMASVIGGRESISSQYIQALESGELTPKLTTTDIGRRTVPKATTPDKISVAETFEKWKKRMIEMGILK